eukprot:TRINITY_DN11130_c0_g2_i1.p2 TRINITY_DN11130_c0_g2~~TRINITY_DN11130_c0_g2_i1.p2  ORF type:complete len:106 (-),score=19.16 TRINITY_DN11130_c0_g2_i1:157-474(-)
MCIRDRIPIQQAFKAFDENNDGTISRSELEKAFRKMKIQVAKKDLEDMMNFIDKNRSGNIDYKEFEKMLKNVQDTYFLLHVVRATQRLLKENTPNLLYKFVHDAY